MAIYDTPPQGDLGGERFVAAELSRLSAALDILRSPPFPRLLTNVAEKITGCLDAGGKVMFCGDGGSAPEAERLAAQVLAGKTRGGRPAAGIALGAASPVLQALVDGFGYEMVFARQVEALARPGDLLYCLSSTGRSEHVINALSAARQQRIATVAFTGESPRSLSRADVVVAMPSSEDVEVQELHMACGHIVFGIVGMTLFPSDCARP